MKKLTAAVGRYQKDGEQKTKWLNIGIINTSSNNKEYMLLDPTVNLAGVLAKQNAMAVAENKKVSENVMVSIFEEQSSGYQGQPQQPQQGQFNQNQQGFSQTQGSNQQNSPQSQGSDDFDDDIPFN